MASALPVGKSIASWKGARRPSKECITGRYCELELFSMDAHGNDLFEAFSQDSDGKNWTYMRYGPFNDLSEFEQWAKTFCFNEPCIFYAVLDKQSGKAIGLVSYLNIQVDWGSIEVGHLNYSPLLQRTTAATEAMYLMMNYAFSELGFRRYQWQCDALNQASRNAALRLGFSFEGILRQATVYKGRSRDSAFFSIIDTEWPALKASFQRWLTSDNFDGSGRQITSLQSMHNAPVS